MLEYTGEFGTEVALFLPYVHYLKKKNLLKGIKTYKGMHPYYFFLNGTEFKTKEVMRRWVHPQGRIFLPDGIKNDDEIFSKEKDRPEYFDPPDLYSHYKKFKLYTTKPLMIIQNKYNSEWGGPPVNFMDVELLDKIISLMKTKFTIIYIRSNEYRGAGYSSDENESLSFVLEDKEMIKKHHQEVFIYEDLVEKQKDSFDFNSLKCVALANAKYTLSTIGGFNFLDAYFPCKHIIYKVDTPPVYNKAFYQNQHNMLCPNPSDIIFVSDKEALLQELGCL